MLKWLLRGALVVAVLAVGGVVFLWIYLDHAAAMALTGGVEQTGQVSCAVRGVSISLLRGKIGLDGLTVKNPAGYGDGTMLSLKRGQARISVGSLWSRPLHIQELELDEPTVRLEPGPAASNVAVFRGNVQRHVGPKIKPQGGPAGGRLLHMTVERITIRNASVKLDPALLPKASRPQGRSIGPGDPAPPRLTDIELGDVELTDIQGRDGRGVTSGELAAIVMSELVSRAVDKAGLSLRDVLPEE